MVCVGPPWLASSVGSSSGFLQNEVPVVLVQPSPVNPHVVPSSSMLWPPSVIAPTQAFWVAEIVLVTVTAPPPQLRMPAPPPSPVSGLPEKVLLVMLLVTASVPSWL